jgi:hypothetical protein
MQSKIGREADKVLVVGDPAWRRKDLIEGGGRGLVHRASEAAVCAFGRAQRSKLMFHVLIFFFFAWVSLGKNKMLLLFLFVCFLRKEHSKFFFFFLWLFGNSVLV